MKCTQCGCEDLKEVDFPYQVNLIMTACGCALEAAYYDLKQTSDATTYICTKCGHFEFFNLKLANIILQERKRKEIIRASIEEIEKKILQNENQINTRIETINQILKQLENLDITIRQSNELKERKAELTEQINSLRTEIKSLEMEKKSLEEK